MKKNVLHIISSITWRGGEQQVDYLFNHVSTDYNYFLFCAESAEIEKRNQQKKTSIFAYKKRFGFDVFAAFKLKKFCTEKQIDLIYLHDSHSINTYLLADLLGINIPCVIHRHINFKINTKWKYTYKKIQKIICVSNTIKNNLSVFVDKKKLVVINPGIDISRFTINNERLKINKLKQELNLSNETKIIGIVSALEKEKNIDEFILIANKLIEKNKNYHFVIIGDGSLKSEFLSLNSQIHTLGFRNDIHELLHYLDAFLFTSNNEGFPLVLLEAMASKVLIFCNNFPSSSEIIHHEKTGFIYNDINDAVQLIEKLLSNIDSRLTTIDNAFNFVQQFDISLMTKKIEEIYKSILSND